MTLPASGAISMSAINTELQVSSTTTRSMNDVRLRELFDSPDSGTGLSMADGYSKDWFVLPADHYFYGSNGMCWAYKNGSGAYIFYKDDKPSGEVVNCGATLLNVGECWRGNIVNTYYYFVGPYQGDSGSQYIYAVGRRKDTDP
jgi:hypothetical protein